VKIESHSKNLYLKQRRISQKEEKETKCLGEIKKGKHVRGRKRVNKKLTTRSLLVPKPRISDSLGNKSFEFAWEEKENQRPRHLK